MLLLLSLVSLLLQVLLETAPKRRSNATHVCHFCKRRKVRCDKGTPCSACVKYGNPICEYPPEALVKKHERAEKKPGFSEFVMSLEQPGQHPMGKGGGGNTKKDGRTSPSSSLASSLSNSSTEGHAHTDYTFGSNMHLELEALKSKISMLERLISGSQHTQEHRPGNSEKHVSVSPVSSVNAAVSLVAPVWQNPDPTSPHDLLFMTGNNPYLSDSQYFSFHNSYVPFVLMRGTSVRHYSALNWVALIKIYSSVSPLFATKHKKFVKARQQVILREDPDRLGPSERVFNKKLREFVGEDGALRSASPAADQSSKEMLRKINHRARAVGLTVYEGNLDSVHDVMEKARLLLPSRKVIWLLVDRFFERVYPFFPFLDQMELEAKVTQILCSDQRDHVPVEKLNIHTKNEMAYLGILLLVLRLAYLTLFTNDDAQNEANLVSNEQTPKAKCLKFLLNNPIDIDVFGVAQDCLFLFGYLRTPSFPILQLCLYLKIYNSYAPENGEGADDSNTQGFCARIIDMAMNLGLHREPENFRTKIRDDRTNNLCRKIWWYLVMVDMLAGLTNGSPVSIRRSQFDTSPPFHKPGNENIKDKLLEVQVIASLARFDECHVKLYDVVSKISDVRSPISMKELCAKISVLEWQFPAALDAVVESLSSLEAHSPHLEIANAHWLNVAFQSTFFMVSVSLHFFNHYEKMGEMDLAYFYLKKLLSVSVNNMMPFYQKFVTTSGDIFHHTTDIAITPSFQTLVHKCSIIIHCVQMRAKFSIVECDMLPSHREDMATDVLYRTRYDLLQETFALCEQCLEIFLASMKRMTSRYYYAWRYCKAQEKLKGIRNGTEYYTTWCRGKESYMMLSDDMLEDLNGILRRSIDTVSKNREKTELVPELLEDFPQDPPDIASTGSPMGHFPTSGTNEQYSDEFWTQMFAMKPDLGNPTAYSETATANMPVDFTSPGSMLDPNFFGSLNGAGAGFYDSLLKDLVNQDGGF